MVQLTELITGEAAARTWVISIIWADGLKCPRCGSDNTCEDRHKTMPYRCRECKRTFSLWTGSAAESSRLPLKKWVWVIYLVIMSLKGASSMKLSRDIGVTQTTAWFMLQWIRKAFVPLLAAAFNGSVEAGETYVGGKE